MGEGAGVLVLEVSDLPTYLYETSTTKIQL